MNRFTKIWPAFALVGLLVANCTDGGPETNPASIEVTPQFDIAGFAYDLTEEGVIVEVNGAQWIPAVAYKVGSGVLNPFLDWKAPGNDDQEDGFNTDGDFEYDQHRKADTNPLPLNILPTIRFEGDDQLYREVILDVNESNDVPAAQMSFEAFELYLCDDPGATTYSLMSQVTTNCDQIYTIDGNLATTDEYTSGSGSDLDYVVLIPETAFENSTVDISGCTYNPVGPDCGVWVILWVSTGGYGGDWIAEGGYEEAASIIRPWVEVTKDANPTYKLTYDWQVTKLADDDLHELLPGGTGTTNYTITVDLDGAPAESDWAVTGDIDIFNPSDGEVEVISVTDLIEGIGDVAVTCPSGPPFTIGSGATVTCTYGYSDFANGDTRDNTATVEISTGGVFEATASINFATDGVVEDRFNASVDAYDTPQGEAPIFLGTVDYDGTLPAVFNRQRSWTFTLPEIEAVCKLHPNLAEVFGDNDVLLDAAEEIVEVRCTSLDVTKTVFTRVERTWNWEITKEAGPDWALFDGESGTSDYEVAVDKVDYDEDGYRVYGVITVYNDGAVDVAVTNVTDEVSNGAPVAATVGPCSPSLGSTLAPGESMTCDYTADLGNASYDANVATAWVTGGGSFVSDEYEVSFAEADLDIIDEVHATVRVEDVFDEGGGPAGSPWTNVTDDDAWQYSRTFTCGDDEGTWDNTATIYGDGDEVLDEASASVDVDCYDLAVTKDVETRFDRDWEWTVTKDFTTGFIDGTENLVCIEVAPDEFECTATLLVGENLTVEYEVSVSATATDFNYEVLSGPNGIEITNNHPTRQADLTQVLDNVGTFGAATVTCPSLTVPAASTLTCTYTTGQQTTKPDDGDNTATATQQLYDFASDGTPTDDGTMDYSSGPVAFAFGDTPYTETNRCADVEDVLAGFPTESFGQVCADEVTFPVMFPAYTRLFINPDHCDNTYVNTATVTPIGTGTPDSDSETLIIDCFEGCTLTQGFYKTHSQFGPAPYSDLWLYVGPDGAATELLGSGYTYYDVYQMAPSGGNLWIKLAHQWMAAWINRAANGGAPTAVSDAIDEAEALLLAYAGDMDIPKGTEDGDDAGDLHSLLASYNEGGQGVPHCTENTLQFIYDIYGPSAP